MPKVNVNPLNYVNLSDGAKFSNSTDYPSSPKTVDNIITKLKDPAIDGLVIYFHGGMVSEDDGAQEAKDMANLLQSKTKHVVSIMWETSLWETLRDEIENAIDSRDITATIEHIFSFIGKIIGVDDKGILQAGTPVSTATAKAELLKRHPFERFEAAFETAFEGPNRHKYLEEIKRGYQEMVVRAASDPEINSILEASQVHITSPYARRRLLVRDGAEEFSVDTLSLGWVMIAIKVAERFIAKRAHGIPCTIIEEALRYYDLSDAAADIWQGMKDKATDMFVPNTPPINEDSRGTAYLADRLQALCATKKSFTIDLIGHSAGSYCIGNLLLQIAASNYRLPIRHVVLMAPACRVDFGTNAFPALSNTFVDLRMFSLHDSLECDDTVEHVYPRSLLYFVSGLCEDKDDDTPIMGMERFVEWQVPYQTDDLAQMHLFLYAANANRLALAKTDNTAPPGMQCDSTTHGNFWSVDHPETRASLKKIVG